MRTVSPENVNKIYFDSSKLSHCNFKDIAFDSIAVFFLYFYLSTSNVTSSNVVKSSFKQCLLVGFLWSCLGHL